MEIKSGSKVRVIKGDGGCDTIKKGDVVEIGYVSNGFYYLKYHKFNKNLGPTQYYLLKDEFELVEEPDKKYIWYLDSEDSVYFLNNLLGVDKWALDETQEIKNGKDMCYMLTEEEARKSPFFDKFKKHDPSEKWYYIRMKGNEDGYLNLNFNDDSYSMNDKDEYGPHKTKFTKEECDEIIGTSSILYKEECRE